MSKFLEVTTPEGSRIFVMVEAITSVRLSGTPEIVAGGKPIALTTDSLAAVLCELKIEA